MKKIYVVISILLVSILAKAQTWNGSTSTAWSDASNWTGGLPTTTSDVTIPGGAPRYPVLSANTTVNSINMQAGSQLDVNGFTFTLAGTASNYNYIVGATLNNSNAATDIVINLNISAGGYNAYFRGNTVNDNISFNLTGSSQFFEGDAGNANVYTGDATFNASAGIPVYISHGVSSQFKGNLTINRTNTAGGTQVFNAGGSVAGNLSFNNNVGGGVTLGNLGARTDIGGTVNIAINHAVNTGFAMYTLVNQTTGGSININEPGGFDIRQDTLKLSSLSVSGYITNYGYLTNNSIAGNVSLADDASSSGGYATYVRNNVITGTSNFTSNSTNAFYEADAGNSGNTFNGNTSFTGVNSGPIYISHGAASQFNGNLTINHTTTAGAMQAFNAGGVVTGNFSVSNNIGGAVVIGNNAAKTTIGGTMNIAINHAANSGFALYHVTNQTGGGSVSVNEPGGFTVQQDTLKLTNFSITGYINNYAYLFNNSIAANVNIADDPTNSGGYTTNIRGNVITGNSTFTINSTNAFYEADNGAGSENVFNGNTSFSAKNSGGFFISHTAPSQYNGDLAISRTAVAGTTQAFNAGGNVTGNFSLSNNIGGLVTIGNATPKTLVNGTVNIAINNSAYSGFTLLHFINQTGGGSIDVSEPGGFTVQFDTLKLTAFSIKEYQNNYGYIYNNSIEGNVSLADNAANGGGYVTYLRNNVITGTSNFTNNGSNAFYEADGAGTGNTFNGNTVFSAVGTGSFYVSHGAASQYNGNLTINHTTAPGATQAFNAGGTVTGNFSVSNNIGGAVTLGNTSARTAIGGTVTIAITHTANYSFAMYRMINQTTGGNITLTEYGGFTVQQDTLKLASFNISGYQNNYAYFLDNSITGDVSIADDPGNGGGYATYLRRNSITGTSSFTNNGSNRLYDASDDAGTATIYTGNVSYTNNGSGAVLVGTVYPVSISQNLTLKSSAGITTGRIKFSGNTNGTVQQLGTQPVAIADLTMEKTGGTTLSLASPLSIGNSLLFTSGVLASTAANKLIFLDNATTTGASDAGYVDGPVVKTGDDAFTFPVGQNGKYAPLSISAPANVADQFQGRYFKTNATAAGYDTAVKDPSLNHVSGREYWTLDRLAGTSAVNVTLSWNSSRSGLVNSLPDLHVARWNGSTWKDEGNGGTTGNGAAGTVQTAGQVTNFSPFTLASISALNPLPVTLIRFAGSKVNGQSRLSWATADESNFSRFEVEKSSNGINFSLLSTVMAKGGVNNTYETNDASPASGRNFYRLKMIDKNNDAKYSPVVVLDFGSKSLLTVYPNPARTTITVSTDMLVKTIAIIDLDGKLVKQLMPAANNQYNVSDLKAGDYFIRISDGREIRTQLFSRQ